MTELNFFCALEAKPLARLFEDRFVLDDLKSLGAGVSLAILDFSEERAEATRLLNKLGIPVTAWLLLPKEQGYWLTRENSAAALEFYSSFQRWSQRKKLNWAGIGLGFKELANNPVLSAFEKTNPDQLKQSRQEYQRLAEQVRADGYRLEIYRPAVMEGARLNGVRILRKAESQLDLPAERQVDLLFSSPLRQKRAGSMWRSLADSQAVGLGMTSRSMLFPEADQAEPLSWQEFTQELRLGMQSGKPVYIFSLEGCARLGYLDRLVTFDLGAPVDTPFAKERYSQRKRVWRSPQHLAGLATLVGILGGTLFFLRRKKSR